MATTMKCAKCGRRVTVGYTFNDPGDCAAFGVPCPSDVCVRCRAQMVALRARKRLEQDEVVSLDTVLQAVVAWSRETFPDRNPQSTAIHLKREAEELDKALMLPALGIDPSEELADVVILAAALADCLKLDLAAAIAEKLAVLKTRTWASPDGEGVREHVRP